MLTTDKIDCSLDFERNGKHFGNLELSFSDNQNAFAKIPVPVVSINNGQGPTLLLSAGNHGDEYEGQVILRRLIHDLSPACRAAVTCSWWRVKWSVTMSPPKMSPRRAGIHATVPRNKTGRYFLR